VVRSHVSYTGDVRVLQSFRDIYRNEVSHGKKEEKILQILYASLSPSLTI
jgi:hypothetical protein